MKEYIKISLECLYLIFIFATFTWIVIQFFGGIVYCDDGSINSTSVLFDRFDLQEPNENSIYNETANCSSVFYHYQYIAKRKIYWYTFVKGKQPIISYNDFKQSWDPNTNVSYEIKKELVKEYKEGMHKFDVYKHTFRWFVQPSTRPRWSR